MMHPKRVRPPIGAGVFCLLGVLWLGQSSPANAETVGCPIAKDNTLFEWDAQQGKPNSNGSGNFFSAGRTRPGPDGTTQRGLIQFDLSAIPADAEITSATLELHVVSVAKRGRETERLFWLQALEGLEESGWGEGDSNADAYAQGEGHGMPAEPGDATWVHTSYDTNLWPVEGAIGGGLVTPGWPSVGSVPGGLDEIPDVPYPVQWGNQQMVEEIQRWVDGTLPEFGWIVIGMEDMTGESYGSKEPSSKRSFASKEYYDAQGVPHPEYAPRLIVRLVPEPSSAAMCAGAMAVVALLASNAAARRRRRASR